MSRPQVCLNLSNQTLNLISDDPECFKCLLLIAYEFVHRNNVNLAPSTFIPEEIYIAGISKFGMTLESFDRALKILHYKYGEIIILSHEEGSGQARIEYTGGVFELENLLSEKDQNFIDHWREKYFSFGELSSSKGENNE